MKLLLLGLGPNYYRLQQFDIDGSSEYSEVQVVEINAQTPIRIFPSHAYETITIDLAESTFENTKISIFDLMGRLIFSESQSIESTRLELNVANLSKGQYFVHLEMGRDRYTERFIKME